MDQHTPQVDGHSWSTPLNAQRVAVSWFATQVQDLTKRVPLAPSIINLSVLSTHVVGAAAGATTGDPVGDAVAQSPQVDLQILEVKAQRL